MSPEDFSEQNESIRHQVKKLSLQTSPSLELLPNALEELQSAFEELQVAEEELIQQNEELSATRQSAETDRQRYQEIFNVAPDGYLITNEYGMIEEANQAAARLLNVPQHLLVGKPLLVFVEFSMRQGFRQKLQQLGHQALESEWEVRLQQRAGSILQVWIKVAVRRNASGLIESLLWLLRDVTPLKQAEQRICLLNEVLTQQVNLDAVARSISDRLRESLDESYILQTATRELVYALSLIACDAAIYDLPSHSSIVATQYIDPAAAIAPSHPGIVDMAQFREGYDQLLQGQEFQFCALTEDGVRRQVAVLACPIVDHQTPIGDLWCFLPREAALEPHQVWLVRQIASQCAIALQQARLYRKAQTQMLELRQINRIKDDFLSTVSHELRTPLTNIKMTAHLLKQSSTDPQQLRLVEILQHECDREILLVNDLLDLQQLESAVYPTFLREAIALSDWMPTVLAPFRQRFEKRQQQFTLNLPEEVPMLVSDRASLRRILAELLHNAHKYTPNSGEIQLTVHSNLEAGSMTFELKNQAEIPAAELPLIFEKFYRLPQADRSQPSGTGLGLPLIKHLAQLLQGAIGVESCGGWTTFTLTIPTTQPLN